MLIFYIYKIDIFLVFKNEYILFLRYKIFINLIYQIFKIKLVYIKQIYKIQYLRKCLLLIISIKQKYFQQFYLQNIREQEQFLRINAIYFQTKIPGHANQIFIMKLQHLYLLLTQTAILSDKLCIHYNLHRNENHHYSKSEPFNQYIMCLQGSAVRKGQERYIIYLYQQQYFIQLHRQKIFLLNKLCMSTHLHQKDELDYRKSEIYNQQILGLLLYNLQELLNYQLIYIYFSFSKSRTLLIIKIVNRQ
ncbi:hypothetical protein IMG5_018000 [Ichthyophthirius multifiliis]|uniref:Uncharacterized protein n=1 Tax=Ichthyophthirius multifiliis TaxID=5932 RepID=G0QKH5_ICHMU|nr:hypothetical protein IMG5_018000 [Ichthyophthirius multifiliis]EGR34279.1 hypothetical protein IMG5_018000 [Ichthyophthirius multifiliis]|eukprot:XP_004039583.1 hypothetical protein IMG5_018000 [Ichthyophthirius multifiliis]